MSNLKKIIFTLLLIVPTVAFAGTIELNGWNTAYTMFFGDLIATFLGATGGTTNYLRTAMVMVALIMLMVNVSKAAVSPMSFTRLVPFFITIMVVMFLTTKTTTVYLIDKSSRASYTSTNFEETNNVTFSTNHNTGSIFDQNGIYIVEKVPVLVAWPFTLTSYASEKFTAFLENLLGMPAEFSLANTDGAKTIPGGYNLVSQIAQDLNSVKITNPMILRNFQTYMTDCVIPANLMLKSTGKPYVLLSDIIGSDNIIDALAVSNSQLTTKFSLSKSLMKDMKKYLEKARSNAETASAKMLSSAERATFTELINYIDASEMNMSTIDTYVDFSTTSLLSCPVAYKAIQAFANLDASMSLTNRTFANSGIFAGYNNAFDYIYKNYNLANDPVSMVKQSAMIHLIQDDFANSSAMTGNNQLTTATATATQLQSQLANMSTISTIANKLMPYIITFYLLLTMAFAPVMTILLITNIGFKAYSFILTGFASMALVQPILAIINIVIWSQSKSGTIANMQDGIFPDTLNLISESSMYLTLYAGFFGASAPLIAGGLLKGTLSLANIGSSGITNAASQAGQAAASGNISLGNTSMNNQSWDKVNQQSQINVGSSSITSGYGAGSFTTKLNLGGALAMQNEQNINSSTSVVNSAGNKLATSTGGTSTISSDDQKKHEQAKAVQKYNELSSNLSKAMQSGNQSEIAKAETEMKNWSNTQSADTKSAVNAQLSWSPTKLVEELMKGGSGGGGGAGGKFGLSDKDATDLSKLDFNKDPHLKPEADRLADMAKFRANMEMDLAKSTDPKEQRRINSALLAHDKKMADQAGRIDALAKRAGYGSSMGSKLMTGLKTGAMATLKSVNASVGGSVAATDSSGSGVDERAIKMNTRSNKQFEGTTFTNNQSAADGTKITGTTTDTDSKDFSKKDSFSTDLKKTDELSSTTNTSQTLVNNAPIAQLMAGKKPKLIESAPINAMANPALAQAQAQANRNNALPGAGTPKVAGHTGKSVAPEVKAQTGKGPLVNTDTSGVPTAGDIQGKAAQVLDSSKTHRVLDETKKNFGGGAGNAIGEGLDHLKK